MIRSMLRYLALAAAGLLAISSVGTARACPFCSAVSLTFAQEIKAADAVVIAQLVELPKGQTSVDGPIAPGIGEPLAKSKFKIIEVLKGAEHLKKAKEVDAVFFGDSPVGTEFLITAIDPKALAWSTPIPLSDRGRKYLTDIMKLPETGADRLVYFQDYLEDEDQMLTRDAHDEFAIAPYEDLRVLAPKIKYEQLIKWIKTPDISPSHRRLYFTMLGVCGTEKDVPLVESFLKTKDRKLKVGFLDAMIGSYLAIKGPTALALVDDLFLKNQEAEFTDTYAAIQAVRIAQEAGILEKDKAAAAFHNVLKRPKIADLVIPDLARWQDWSVVDRMVELFMIPGDDSSWLRAPVLRYLQVCPLPEAKKQLAKLEALDPTAAKQAQSFMLPGGAAMPSAPAPASTNSTKPSGGVKSK
jgi:hypothetical protein